MWGSEMTFVVNSRKPRRSHFNNVEYLTEIYTKIKDYDRHLFCCVDLFPHKSTKYTLLIRLLNELNVKRMRDCFFNGARYLFDRNEALFSLESHINRVRTLQIQK